MFKSLVNKLLGRQVLTRPEQIPPYIIDHFDEATEEEISAAAAHICQTHPNSPEIALMYALRVSKIVPRVKTFKTLGSRWRTANSGPRGAVGLLAGRHSKNYDRTYQFLARLYLKRFAELCEQIADKANQNAAKRKGTAAKQKALSTAKAKIKEGGRELDHYPAFKREAGLWRQEAERWTQYLG